MGWVLYGLKEVCPAISEQLNQLSLFVRNLTSHSCDYEDRPVFSNTTA
jgi:hypothetical protein